MRPSFATSVPGENLRGSAQHPLPPPPHAHHVEALALRCRGLCGHRGVRQGPVHLALAPARTAQRDPQPRHLRARLRRARSRAVRRDLHRVDPEPARGAARRERGPRWPDAAPQRRRRRRPGASGQRLGAGPPTRLRPAPHGGQEQRAERSATAKGRSLCPQGSAGGRWQIPAVPELLRRLELAGCPSALLRALSLSKRHRHPWCDGLPENHRPRNP